MCEDGGRNPSVRKAGERARPTESKQAGSRAERLLMGGAKGAGFGSVVRMSGTESFALC